MDMELLHDLRLPLQLIQASAELLGQSADGASREYLAQLMDGVNQMRRMLDSALSADPRGEFAPVEAVGSLRALCLRCRDWASRRGVALTFSSNVAALTLLTDADRLSRIALNLIMNAIRFSPPGGTVAVRCAALGDFVEIAVADQGRGIAPDRLPYVFLRGETDGGTGYGLPSAMDGARLLGGSLSATSHPGGTTFTLRLPVRGEMVS